MSKEHKTSSETRQFWHEEGQKDAKAGRTGPLNGPWCGPFESFERYDERNDAWKQGVENQRGNKR